MGLPTPNSDGSYTVLGATLDLDKIDGAVASQDILEGIRFTQIAHIENVWGTSTPPITTTSNLLLQQALTIMSASGYIVGLYGESVAIAGVSCYAYLANIRPSSLSTDHIKLELEYRGYPATQISIGTSLSSIQSPTDSDGNPLYVTYAYDISVQNANTNDFSTPQVIGPWTDNNGVMHAGWNNPTGSITQGCLATKTVQEEMLTFKFPVNASTAITGFTGTTVLARCQNFQSTYLGMINAAAWAPAPGLPSGAPRTWLLETFRAESRDGGNTFEAVVTYHYRADTWDELLVFKSKYDGLPAVNLVIGPSVTSDVSDVDNHLAGVKRAKKYKLGTLPVMPVAGALLE